MDDLARLLERRLAAFRVLASGSEGNCSILVMPGPRIILIDAGLSPRRTRRALESMRLGCEAIDAVLITHLDHDHWKHAWNRCLPTHTIVYCHHAHAAVGRRNGLLPATVSIFDRAIDLAPGVRADPFTAPHDEHGVISYRLTICAGDMTATLGFATDLGRAGDGLVSHLRGVDVLAIESNYCPDLQRASPRPLSLKRRIMGGSGHLSNQQCLHAVEAIEPREHVVLLHLSRDCNHPGLAAALHEGADYALTISSQSSPTRWIGLGRIGAAPGLQVQMPLFAASAFGAAG